MVARELTLFKISCPDGDSRAQVMQLTETFRGMTLGSPRARMIGSTYGTWLGMKPVSKSIRWQRRGYPPKRGHKVRIASGRASHI
jgi:hypothetical protein